MAEMNSGEMVLSCVLYAAMKIYCCAPVLTKSLTVICLQTVIFVFPLQSVWRRYAGDRDFPGTWIRHVKNRAHNEARRLSRIAVGRISRVDFSLGKHTWQWIIRFFDCLPLKMTLDQKVLLLNAQTISKLSG